MITVFRFGVAGEGFKIQQDKYPLSSTNLSLLM